MRAAFLTVVLGMASASTTLATTIDFQEFEEHPGYDGTLTSQGYLFTAVGSNPPLYALFADGSNKFFASCPGCTTTLQTEAGDSFSLFSLDLGLVSESTAFTYAITGYLTGGGTVQKLVTVNAFAPSYTWSTLEFGAEWQGLQLESVVFGAGLVPIFDNIAVSTVPVPPALLLFGSAIAGLIGFRRRARLTGRPGCL